MGTGKSTAELRRDQAEEASKIIGRRYRNLRTGKVSMVTDIVRIHRRGAEVVEETDTGPVYRGEKIRIVLDDRLRISPKAFFAGWTKAT